MLDNGIINHGGLWCYWCTGGHLHHDRVEVGFRKAEDEALSSVAVTSSSGTDLQMMKVGGRRDEIRVHLHCEECGERSILQIRQHKGNTLIGWDWEFRDV